MEEETTAPPMPSHHLFPRPAAAASVASSPSSSSNSYLEALRRMTIDSCLRPTTNTCLHTHGLYLSLSVHVSLCLSVCIYLSVCLAVCLSALLYICLSLRVSIKIMLPAGTSYGSLSWTRRYKDSAILGRCCLRRPCCHKRQCHFLRIGASGSSSASSSSEPYSFTIARGRCHKATPTPHLCPTKPVQ